METTMQGIDPHAKEPLRPDAGILEDRGRCPYLPDRHWIVRSTEDCLTTRDYEQGLVHGWRRSAMNFYRPVCPGCSQCIPIRLDTHSWIPSARMRRLERRNHDIRLGSGERGYNEERFRLYLRYMAARHGSNEAIDDETRFIYLAVYCLDYFSDSDFSILKKRTGHKVSAESIVDGFTGGSLHSSLSEGTAIMDFRRADDETLVATDYIDILPSGISSVYFAFDPDESKRSLGLWSIAREIAFTAHLGKRYYHLGFWVPGSPKMDYKASFPPFELAMDGRWVHATSLAEALALAATLPGFAAQCSTPETHTREEPHEKRDGSPHPWN